MKVRLSKRDMLEAELMARDTVFMLERMSISPRLENNNQSRLDANIFGFMAEFAVCRVLGTEPPRLNFATDGGVDLWLGDVTIDVKYTARKTSKLIFDSVDKFKSQVAILVTATDNMDVMEILGWCSKGRFIEDSYSKDFGYGKRLVMDADKLQPIEQFWLKYTQNKYL